MKNILKKIAEKSVENAFTTLNHYQPKMPDSLMEKIQVENKKEG
uniref:AgrD n=1 Tax=Siphoviridae sp. ctyvQ1 TaxID=2826525 RepID=A0A8S5R0K5_9CAUD|nr:MAG TPA: AgrD [Siphoviridae sp. ctyvQ1]